MSDFHLPGINIKGGEHLQVLGISCTKVEKNIRGKLDVRDRNRADRVAESITIDFQKVTIDLVRRTTRFAFQPLGRTRGIIRFTFEIPHSQSGTICEDPSHKPRKG